MAPLVGSLRNKFLSTIMSFWTLSISLVKTVGSIFMSSTDGETFVRPRVPVEINNITSNWLYDTGASRSCISTDQFHALFPHGFDTIFQSQMPNSGLQDAGGNSLHLQGIVPLKLTILGKTITHEVWVCNKL